ncbi:hypothetical protein ACUZXZ_16250 [Pseudomonas juntendi]|uniref:hypothetical protein n=1 Tax=Pseudomonas TaxID=286 RepID=UPI001F257E0A|nr:hypothetical protein [Pseudomonas juntendi]MCO7055116.1 hypothetical protein [Pseudomonas juntendi]UJM10788.1 hypothetical protein L1P09_15735 [Pseudomonas juntendi]
MTEFLIAATGLLASIIILLVLVVLPIAAYQIQTASFEISQLLWEEFRRLHGEEDGHD